MEVGTGVALPSGEVNSPYSFQEAGMNCTRARSGWLWLLFLVLTLTVFILTPDAEARVRRIRVTAPVGTATCEGCHIGWQDNNPPGNDIATNNADITYFPLNFAPRSNSFYFIPEAYRASIHATPQFDLTATDFVTCEACHGSGAAHFGVGPIPYPIPQTNICISCHTTPVFDSASFLQTAHANPDRKPTINFDQLRNGPAQAKIKITGILGAVSLFKANDSPVTRNERIEECSVCHVYALQYPQFQDMIADGSYKSLKTEVGCGACHDAHIPASNANSPASPNSTVAVAAVSGSTVTSVTPAPGRQVFYPNHKPYKIDGTGAQSAVGSTWVRGSAIARPSRAIVSGIGIVGDTGGAKSNLLAFAGGGFLGNVKPGDTVLISGVASNTINLPAAAVDAGKPVTVQATLDKTGGYRVEQVISDTQLEITTRTETDSATNPVNAQLGTNVIAVVAKSTVTYTKTPSGTATVSVFVPFSGSFDFEIRDMYSNTEDLCGSCHTQGTLKYTAKGATRDGTPVAVNLASTHNTNVRGQYRNSGHGTRTAQPFEEFTVYGGHQLFYPYDMSITGSGGVGSLRNKGNINLQLTPASTSANEYLSASGNTTLPGLAGNFACLQCHHGLASIDYQLNRHGTQDAQVLWGDTTVTCITCHGPHDKGAEGRGADGTIGYSNIRVPVMLSFNSRFTGGATNRMMDGTPIPAGAGKGIICLFCHQGRESGFTVYKYIQTRGVPDPYATPTAALSAGSSSTNSHYLAGGALLWSKNAWEFLFNNVPQSYTNGNASHQGVNCTGCHMSEANADNTEGGHTWRPRIDGPCQDCHPGMTDYKTYPNLHGGDYDGDGVVKPTAQEIDGLIAQITAALAANNIKYDPSTNPYFFPIVGNSISWTVNLNTASYNLNEVFKSANALYVHNPMYVIQVLRDSLQSITGTVPPGDRPPGERPATDYRTITP